VAVLGVGFDFHRDEEREFFAIGEAEIGPDYSVALNASATGYLRDRHLTGDNVGDFEVIDLLVAVVLDRDFVGQGVARARYVAVVRLFDC